METVKFVVHQVTDVVGAIAICGGMAVLFVASVAMFTSSRGRPFGKLTRLDAFHRRALFFAGSLLVAFGITNIGIAFTLLSIGIETGMTSSLRHSDPIWAGVLLTCLGAAASVYLGGKLLVHFGRQGWR